MALRAKFKVETDVFFMILRSKTNESSAVSNDDLAGMAEKSFSQNPRRFTQAHNILRVCVKSLFMALRAKFKFETDVFFMILRSKINEPSAVSNDDLAGMAEKKHFRKPRRFYIIP